MSDEPAAKRCRSDRFAVGQFYLNCVPGERPSPRNLRWKDLLPNNIESALLTSLEPERSYTWLREVSPGLKRALLVAERCPKVEPTPAPELIRRDDEWLVLAGQRGSGLMHCSLMLFRTACFLRLVLGGTNLEGQFLVDRDAIFVQDFPIKEGAKASDNKPFGARLEAFLRVLPGCFDTKRCTLDSESRSTVCGRCEQLLTNVDFSGAEGAFIYSAPGSKHGKGGWMQLCDGLAEIRAPLLDHNSRLDVAAGHYGAMKQDFFVQMAKAFRRDHSTGNDLASVGHAFLHHPSRRTVLGPSVNSFTVMRFTAPAENLLNTDILDKYFHDAIPKFDPESSTEELLVPLLHGKAVLCTSADGSAGVMFVGSHNFSKTAWGEGNQQPGNVECGVVLKASGIAEVEELRNRFPVHLAPDARFAEPAAKRKYVMARGPTDGDYTSGNGLQARWRRCCNDLNYLNEWRDFLHGYWGICSSCGNDVPDPPRGNIEAAEKRAKAGEAVLCARCASRGLIKRWEGNGVQT